MPQVISGQSVTDNVNLSVSESNWSIAYSYLLILKSELRCFYRARYAVPGICYGRVSVCVSVCLCLSVTSRSSTKMAEHRKTQIMPHDSPETLVF